MDIKSLISKLTIYQYMAAFLIVFILISAFFYGVFNEFGLNALSTIIIAVLTTTILDSAISYFKTKQWGFPQSALISGLFIGGLLVQGLQWYIYVATGIIAILSKHLIRIKGKNVFNPANFGILLVAVLFNAPNSWWIASPIILVLIFGIFIIWRLKRFDLTISFLISYFLINSAIELYKGAQFSDIYLAIITGNIIYFFSMFMLIEPKTTPFGRKQRIAYGVLVALLLIVLHIKIPKHDLPLALAIGNVFVPILNKINFDFKKKEEISQSS